MNQATTTALALVLGTLVLLIFIFPPLQAILGGLIVLAMIAGVGIEAWDRRRRSRL